MNGFGGLYAGKRVLVTGHTGFKGSWLALWLRALGAEVIGLALDPDTSPSHWSLLRLDGIADLRIDLRNAEALADALQQHRPQIVLHLAAQPLVRRSYREPAATFASNVTGLVHLLEAVRACGSVRVLVNATTDKVYADHAGAAAYRESDPLGGHDPYSTSKACAELVTDCYRKSYFHDSAVRIATARAGNVIGGGDWAEDRLVPDLVRAAASGQALRIRNPAAIRPWQHVLEPLSGYLRLGQRLWEDASVAGAWNFGPGPAGETDVQTLVQRLGQHWGALRIEHDDAPHPHEAAQLRLDTSKAQHALHWRPVWDIDTTLARTAAWYRHFYSTQRIASADDLHTYVQDAQSRGLAWVQ
jgi:CDP-glucose 4,6-dehydratase